MTPHPPTGIKVIVIGGGFGGLATAIECVRQGHEVEIFEQANQFTALGMRLYRLAFVCGKESNTLTEII
jgi:monoamine oxidase